MPEGATGKDSLRKLTSLHVVCKVSSASRASSGIHVRLPVFQTGVSGCPPNGLAKLCICGYCFVFASVPAGVTPVRVSSRVAVVLMVLLNGRSASSAVKARTAWLRACRRPSAWSYTHLLSPRCLSVPGWLYGTSSRMLTPRNVIVTRA